MQHYQRSSFTLLACWILLACLITPLAVAGQRLALVIGNADYQALDPLKNPLRDAEAIGKVVEQQLGFELYGDQVWEDLDEKAFLKVMGGFREQAGGKEIALLYYSGHGAQLADEQFLLPIDLPKDIELLERRAINLQKSLKALDGQAQLTITIFDACREIPELKQAAVKAGFNDPFRSLSRSDAPSGNSQIIAYASAAGQFAADGKGKHSPYTETLLHYLKEKPATEIGNLFRDVATEVWENLQDQARQQQRTDLKNLQSPNVVIQNVKSNTYYFLPPRQPHPPQAVKPVARREDADEAVFWAWDAAYGLALGGVMLILTMILAYRFGRHGSVMGGAGVTLPSFRLPLAEWWTALSSLLRSALALMFKWLRWGVVLGLVIGVFRSGYIAEAMQRARDVYEQAMATATHSGSTEVDVVNAKVEPAPKPFIKTEYQGIRLLPIKGGCFQMGSPVNEDGRYDDEQQHRVCVEDFRLGESEVTQGQWQAVMGSNPSRFTSCGADCPVENVSWDDAQQFIVRLNQQSGQHYRLPTEAEWEYACRSGGQAQTYCGGNAVDGLAWYDGNSSNKTHRVKQKAVNGLGLYDMSGNVREWTCSAFQEAYDGSEKTCTNDANSQRVYRGGSWGIGPAGVRSAYRYGDTPSGRFNYVGFRLAQDR